MTLHKYATKYNAKDKQIVLQIEQRWIRKIKQNLYKAIGNLRDHT